MLEFIRMKLSQLESLVDSANQQDDTIPTYIIQDFIELVTDELDELEVTLEEESYEE